VGVSPCVRACLCIRVCACARVCVQKGRCLRECRICECTQTWTRAFACAAKCPVSCPYASLQALRTCCILLAPMPCPRQPHSSDLAPRCGAARAHLLPGGSCKAWTHTATAGAWSSRSPAGRRARMHVRLSVQVYRRARPSQHVGASARSHSRCQGAERRP
jgi:hypothetical protein